MYSSNLSNEFDATDENESSRQTPSSSQATADSNRYNISNLLKQIYSLKYSPNLPSSLSSSSSASTLTSGGQTTSNSEQSGSATSLAGSRPASTAESLAAVGGAAAAASTTGHHKQFWMPDDQVKECYECNEKFTTFRRRHV